MNSKILRILISAGLLLCLKIPTLSAEAVFTVSASSAIGADIGVTELTGRVILTVSSGSTVAAPFVIDYSAPITNNAASEISILGTGGLVGIAPSPALDRTNNRIRIDVPEGGGAGSTIQITGVRVSLVGLDGTKVAATISSPLPTGNSILAEQRTVVVINSVMQPLVVDLGNNPIKIPNLSHDTVDTSFLITEQYATAFTSAVGNYGQTTATQVRINPFPSIPSGVTLTFAATAPSAATGAVFTTTSGQDETVPRSDGTTSVIYQFTGAGGSDNSIESFRFNVTASIHPPAGTGSITFQATLLPIGIAVPNSQSPSVDIPRYIERPVPDEADLQTDTVRLAFPFLSQSFSGAYTGIALTNPIPYRVKVSLTAYDSGGNLISGPGITNPVDLTMPRSGQYAKLASEIFGPTFNSSTAGTIVAQGKTSDLPGFYLAGGTIAGKGLDGATAGFSSVARWVFPTVFHQGPSPTTVLQMFNPGSEPANALLKLYDSTGSLKSTTS
ncbi:MAG TPA: hypothetical protein VE398_08400, partial [Acidobacteriota bacterium]|nr:hypothetical protein [Acidobacteriota bacterium]